MGSPLTEVMTMLLQCYCFSTVVKVSNTGLGVVILMLVSYEYSAFSVQLWWLQTAAASVTGRQISSLLFDRLTVTITYRYHMRDHRLPVE